MEEDKQLPAVTPASAEIAPAPTTKARALRRRIAPTPKGEAIELSSLPPHTNTQTNGPTVPEPAHTWNSNTNTDTHHHGTAEDATQDQDQDQDHHRIHVPAILHKPASELNSLQRFWARHVSLAVEHEACRDHLALERTYLAYLRTSLAFSNFGVALAQLFRISASDTSSSPSSSSPPTALYHAGKPLSTIFIVIGIAVALVGTWRFFQQQEALVARGKVVARGWEIWGLGVGSLGVMAALWVVLVVKG